MTLCHMLMSERTEDRIYMYVHASGVSQDAASLFVGEMPKIKREGSNNGAIRVIA